MTRTFFALVLIAAVVGTTSHAQVGAGGTTKTFDRGAMKLGGVSIAADFKRLETTVDLLRLQSNPYAGIASGLFQGNVTIYQGDAIVKADEATYNGATHELQLSGNVRMIVPDAGASAK